MESILIFCLISAEFYITRDFDSLEEWALAKEKEMPDGDKKIEYKKIPCTGVKRKKKKKAKPRQK
ncbi:MAG: hypothetical protein Q7J14_01835 [Candidatus Magasanikbacteria bacterium]|nr:hypothetical protein [Candidatus Magasanikbacteria bacterium]